MDHHRIATRRRILKAGSIEIGGDAIYCIVRNVSETGAALEVLSPLYIPDRFTLVVRTDELKRDRKSTRLNSSHANISYAVFCLKKKKTIKRLRRSAV